MRQWLLSYGSSDLARSLAMLADPWTLLILEASYSGARRFQHFQERLGISRQVLATRLERMVELDLLRRDPYQVRPLRYEYIITAAGADAVQVLVAFERWSQRHGHQARYTVSQHRRCSSEVRMMYCSRCDCAVHLSDLERIKPDRD